MSLLVTLNPEPGFAPEISRALPERLIAGDPLYKTWLLDEARNGTIRTGIWEATQGETRSLKGETFEFCYILCGRAEITEDGKVPVTYGPSDSFVMKPGFTGVWKTLETVRKIFVVVA